MIKLGIKEPLKDKIMVSKYRRIIFATEPKKGLSFLLLYSFHLIIYSFFYSCIN